MDVSSPWLLDLNSLYAKYVKWVSGNPSALGDVEMAVKWLSYFVAGKINNSPAVSELVYSLSNLLVFFNDRIIEKANGCTIQTDSSSLARQIKNILTMLEYCEVFIELSAHKLWGSRGRWFVIVVVQSVKCIGRLILTMFCQNNHIVKNPPIPVLDRSNLTETNRPDSTFQEQSDTVVLKRSGRVLRKVEGAPPIATRNFKKLKHGPVVIQYGGRFIRTAELMYIFKPIVHLACIRLYGMKSWKSYLVPMAIDAASLRIYYKHRSDLSRDQKQELSRRCVSMLLYLMRSPFYDRYSKQRIASLLTGIGSKVPFTGAITSMILSYIPHWQETYFYMWST